jgi:amino-acid N-acetyltransferase
MDSLSANEAVQLRSATGADREAIERLLMQSSLPIDGVAHILDTHPGDFVVATRDEADGCVGVAGLEVRGDGALLRSVAVRADAQRRGLGLQLVERALERAQQRHVRSLYLLTTTATDYFVRLGFVRVERADVPPAIAETVEFTSACPASAVVMHRALV